MEIYKKNHKNKLNDDIINEQDASIGKRFFLMRLKDESGKCQQIKIYENSNASELAYNFCRDNDYDYLQMKYVKENIKKIIKKFEELDSNIMFLNESNSSIQEVDEEENFKSEGTLKNPSEINTIEKNSKNPIMKLDVDNTNKSSQKTYFDMKEMNFSHENQKFQEIKNKEQETNSTAKNYSIENLNKINNFKDKINNNNFKDNKLTGNKIILFDLSNKIENNKDVCLNVIQKESNNNTILNTSNDENDLKNSENKEKDSNAISNPKENDKDENQLNNELINKSKEISFNCIDNNKTEITLKKSSTTNSNTRNFTGSSNNYKKTTKQKIDNNKLNDIENIKTNDYKKIITSHEKYIDKKLVDMTKYYNSMRKKPYKDDINLSKKKMNHQISSQPKDNSTYTKNNDFNIFKDEVESDRKLAKDYLFYKYADKIKTNVKTKPQLKSEPLIFLPYKIIDRNLNINNSFNKKKLNKTNFNHTRNIADVKNNYFITYSKNASRHISVINSVSDIHKKTQKEKNKEGNNVQKKRLNLTNNLYTTIFNINNYFWNNLPNKQYLRSKSVVPKEKEKKNTNNNIVIRDKISNKNSKNKTKENINTNNEIYQKIKNDSYIKKKLSPNNSFRKRNYIMKKNINNKTFNKILRNSNEKSLTENNKDNLICTFAENQLVNKNNFSTNLTNTSLNISKRTDESSANINNCPNYSNIVRKFIYINNRNHGVINKKKFNLRENLPKLNSFYLKAANSSQKFKRISTCTNYNLDYYHDNNHEIYKKTKLISNKNKFTNNSISHGEFSSKNKNKKISNLILNSNSGFMRINTENYNNSGEKSSRSKANNKDNKTTEKKIINLRRGCGLDTFRNKVLKNQKKNKRLGLDIKIILNNKVNQKLNE